MAERRDKKNRKLWKGEYQRPDGRYMYKYVDCDGKPSFIYSWTLTQTDRAPVGKETSTCLREMEKEIQANLIEKINSRKSKKLTLNQKYEEYISTKVNIKESTLSMYNFLYNRHIKNSIGERLISSFGYTDVKNFYISLLNKYNVSIDTVGTIHAILNAIFKIAVRDGIIRHSPTNGVFSEIKKIYPNTAHRKHALTVEQQENLLKFVNGHNRYDRWYGLLVFLLGTGCRIGEALALTWNDCDFENGVIDINHALCIRNRPEQGRNRMYISTPKTKHSKRQIPMLKIVKEVLLEIKNMQSNSRISSPELDGYTGFIFLNRQNKLLDYSGVDRSLKRIVKSYNQEEITNAQKENRQPELLPMFSLHNLRHTFCTRLCSNETNLKIIQEIMGHSNISITMNIYNEVNIQQKQSSFYNLEGKIIV